MFGLRFLLAMGGLLVFSCQTHSPVPLSVDGESLGIGQSKDSAIIQLPSIMETRDSESFHGPRYGGIMKLANRGDPPAGFDPLRTSSIALHHPGGALFGPGNLVMRCRENMYLVCPYLATKWTVNSGFTEWIFTIRQDVYWHDGSALSPEDIKFWLDLALFGTIDGVVVRAPAYFSNSLGSVSGIEVLTNNRIKISSVIRTPQLLEIISDPRFKVAHPSRIFRDKILEGDTNTTPTDVGLIGMGPFEFREFIPGSVIKLRKFNNYFESTVYGELPYLDGIDYIIMPDPFAMDVAFRTGRLDGGARGQKHYLSSGRMGGYVKDLGSTVKFMKIDGGNFRLAFNVLKPGPWNEPSVRRAMSLWIDKESAIPGALGGFGYTTPNLFAPDTEVPEIRAVFINWPKFDLENLEEKRKNARELMEQTGYGDGFAMSHLCRSINLLPCEYLKAELSGLGIDLHLDIIDEGEWTEARGSLRFDSQQGRLTPSPIPEATESVFGRYSKNPDAYSKHEDNHVDYLYSELRESLDFQSRVTRWREIEKYLFLEQTYVIPIAESINVIPYRTNVKGLFAPIEDAHTHTDFATVWKEPTSN